VLNEKKTEISSKQESLMADKLGKHFPGMFWAETFLKFHHRWLTENEHARAQMPELGADSPE
jgi:hypothetical protein